MVIHSIVRKTDVFEFKIQDLSGNFLFKQNIDRVERETLLSLPNQNNEEALKPHQHLQNITTTDTGKEKELLIQLIFSASNFKKI